MARAAHARTRTTARRRRRSRRRTSPLGRWDDLEVFYAESGKWDEFIRVLEQQEAKETDAEAKIGMLVKIAELWADQKQKNDRAARAYEKVLELEPLEPAAPPRRSSRSTRRPATARRSRTRSR